MRVTGMFSGFETESIISELVSAKSSKVTKLKNEQKKLEWKQEVWQNLNTKIYSFYSKKLTNMRYESSYAKRKTSSSNESIASVVAGDNAVTGSQTLKVNSLAQSGYLTGAKIKGPVHSDNPTGKVSSDTILSKINSNLTGSTISVTVGNGETQNIEITSDMTVNGLVSELKKAGLNASFDATNQRFFINSKEMGADNDFTITATNIPNADGSGSMSALRALGLDTTATADEYNDLFGFSTNCTKIDGTDAEIILNGATFTGSSNTFSINGLTIDVKGTTSADETVTFTTTADTDGIYDMIKDFFEDYNEMINEISRLYNADSASDYDVLTAEQKETMTDEEIETWENKIKDSLLRRDTTLNTIISSMNSIMSEGVKMSDGKTMYLAKFGIGTLNYFECEDNEHYAYHIDGDEDDEKTSGKTDKLKSMIATDPDTVTEFFATLSKSLYSKFDELMASTEYSSIYKVYNDKELKTQYKKYDTKISDAQDELNDYEDKWYDKFTAMEVALSKLQSNQNAVSSMLGM